MLGENQVRCITYCTEMHGGYGMSRHWVNPMADLFIASLPETRDAAIALGMPAQRIQLGGFLLHPSFYDTPQTTEVDQFWTAQLQLNPRIFTLILATGANGANHHRRILHALRHFELPLQMVALCGHSKKTQQNVLHLAEKYQSATLSIRALPTTDKMATLMLGASAILTRPGAGTTSEAIQMACPLLINKLTGLMPQEMINERFTNKHQISTSLSHPNDLSSLLRRWMMNPVHLDAVSQRMNTVKPQQHPSDMLCLLETM